MDYPKELIFIDGKNKTDSVIWHAEDPRQHAVRFRGGERVYRYNPGHVKTLPLRREIDPGSVVCVLRGQPVTDAEKILDYGPYYGIVRSGSVRYCRADELDLSGNLLADDRARRLFRYFQATAEATSLKTEDGRNLLGEQYRRITAVSDRTALGAYLNPTLTLERSACPDTLLYPFGLNLSQKKAVENAFSCSWSIIQGPPGTGKTQTILNILANAVAMGKTVAVVSNNNSATKNVADKLARNDLDFITASLGSLANKTEFLSRQSGTYPDMSAWTLDGSEKRRLRERVRALTGELSDLLEAKNRIATLQSELSSAGTEQRYYLDFCKNTADFDIDAGIFSSFSSEKLLRLSLAVELARQDDRAPSLRARLSAALHFGFRAAKLLRADPGAATQALQRLFYERRIAELENEKKALEAALSQSSFEEKTAELTESSMRLLKAELANRYSNNSTRKQFEMADFRSKSEDFLKEYPVVLSTTHSIRGTLSPSVIYDFLIVDEASQVDLSTGVCALSCAKNVVIVGDLRQLPNVLTAGDVKTADAVGREFDPEDGYRFTAHSLLSSAVAVRADAPSVLLREHYRCHPKIAGFFNDKFYNGELVVMSRDRGEDDVLSVVHTVSGNHDRGHVNRRQIDVVEREILPRLRERGFDDIGIITPYRRQAEAMRAQLGDNLEIDTVHKFQGREKDAIVLVSVDNEIGEFADDPNLLNVAVSRAVRALRVVMSDSTANADTNFGDLERYVRYCNFEVTQSRVNSVFDLLCKCRRQARWAYLRGKKHVSEFDSENLMAALLDEILADARFSGLDYAVHSPLGDLVRDRSVLTEREREYALHPWTHLDFLLYRRLDRSPVLVIEVDGVGNHAEGTKQFERDRTKDSVLQKCGVPILRLPTNGSSERERIVKALNTIL